MEIELLKLWLDRKVKEIENTFNDVTNLKAVYETRGKLQVIEELYDFFCLDTVSMEEVVHHAEI